MMVLILPLILASLGATQPTPESVIAIAERVCLPWVRGGTISAVQSAAAREGLTGSDAAAGRLPAFAGTGVRVALAEAAGARGCKIAAPEADAAAFRAAMDRALRSRGYTQRPDRSGWLVPSERAGSQATMQYDGIDGSDGRPVSGEVILQYDGVDNSSAVSGFAITVRSTPAR